VAEKMLALLVAHANEVHGDRAPGPGDAARALRAAAKPLALHWSGGPERPAPGRHALPERLTGSIEVGAGSRYSGDVSAAQPAIRPKPTLMAGPAVVLSTRRSLRTGVVSRARLSYWVARGASRQRGFSRAMNHTTAVTAKAAIIGGALAGIASVT
jgi:hypothetical protein